jgi:hypothetical protein
VSETVGFGGGSYPNLGDSESNPLNAVESLRAIGGDAAYGIRRYPLISRPG